MSDTASDLGYVLAFSDEAGEYHPFATWALNDEGATFWGHYHGTLADALRDFNTRR
jgi:hypothetical protein